VRESRRARRVSFSIQSSREVRVVVPPRFLHAPVEPLLRRHASWIVRTLEHVRSHEIPLQSGYVLPLLGEPRTLLVRKRPGGNGGVTVTPSEVLVTCSDEEGDDELRRLLAGWCMTVARERLPLRTAELARAGGYTYRSLTIRNQSTRWGSCSRNGGISLNWRLVLLPMEVAEYLIFHELAHLVHHDHSGRFWEEVERVYPAWRNAERWLRSRGRSLPL
jgi:predicted metal-dependent hydrolase